VLATGSAANAAYLRSLGADQVIDYHATPFEAVAKEVDVVLDPVGGETQARSFGVLKTGGYLVATTQPPSEEEARKRLVHAVMIRMQPSTEGPARLAALLDAGTIRTVVTKTYPLSQARDAWVEHQSGHGRGKVVLEVPA
jgi:NADPH:quinone reductase-like Zn-dependent oxidoreductase